MKKAIIFDLDGTLINTDSITISLINELREEEGLTPLSSELIRPYLAVGGLALIQKTVSNNDSIIQNTKYLQRLRLKISEHKIDKNLLFPDVKFALKQLSRNNIHLSICTNKASALTHKILSDLDISVFFKTVIADGDLETRKPNHSNFLACTRGLDLDKSEYLIIGDSRVDLELSKNSGIDFLAYDNRENFKFIEKFDGKVFKCYRELVKSVLN